MNNPFRKFIQKYFSFLKSDRSAVLVLGSLILLSFIVYLVVDRLQPKSKYNYSDYAKMFEKLESDQMDEKLEDKYLFDFDPNEIKEEKLDSLNIPTKIKQNLLKYRQAGGTFYSAEQFRKIYGMNDSIFSVIEQYIIIQKIKNNLSENQIEKPESVAGFFDPNDAESETLTLFGFRSNQINNLVKFRNNGGVFYQKNDLLKIYGVDSSFFNSIEKHIRIKPVVKDEPVKNEAKILVEINSADTSELIKLRGIGSVFAKRILKYRDLLGGYSSKYQLLEVYNFPIETFSMIEDMIEVDTLLIKKIRINFAEYRELLKHPYLNKTQVEAVLEYRENNGTFENLEQIELIPQINSQTFVKIRPYLTCR